MCIIVHITFRRHTMIANIWKLRQIVQSIFTCIQDKLNILCIILFPTFPVYNMFIRRVSFFNTHSPANVPLVIFINNLVPLVSFFTPWKHQKTSCCLIFSVGMKWEWNLAKMMQLLDNLLAKRKTHCKKNEIFH